MRILILPNNLKTLRSLSTDHGLSLAQINFIFKEAQQLSRVVTITCFLLKFSYRYLKMH